MPDNKQLQSRLRPQGSSRRALDFMRLFARLRRFNNRQRLAVCCFLSELVNGDTVVALIEQIARSRLACPRCQSRKCARHGHANGLQRYRCSNCGRTFNGLTGTPLARLRLKHKWLMYLDCMRDPACTVHRAADRVQVHPNTSFRWRHRFLEWAKLDRPAKLEGIVEADETFLLESQKGKNTYCVPHASEAGWQHTGAFQQTSSISSSPATAAATPSIF